MPATVHVIARFIARAGKEEELRSVLTALIPAARREVACYQYDLLRSAVDPREFCFIERWETDAALEQHLAMPYVAAAMAQAQPLIDAPPDVRRYRVL